LVLAGLLQNEQRFSDLGMPLLVLERFNLGGFMGPAVSLEDVTFDVAHDIDLQIYTAELQQIVDNPRHSLVVGGRVQGGEFETLSTISNPSMSGDPNPPVYVTEPIVVQTRERFEHVSFYGYETIKLLSGRLRLTGGLAYEWIQYPENFRNPPIQPGVETREGFYPKAGFVYEVSPRLTFRGIYAESLGGVSLDESYRLEPTQLNGFSQTFRTIIPESLVSSVSAPEHVVMGAAMDLKFPSRTYVAVRGQLLTSEIRQTTGAFDYFFTEMGTNTFTSGTRQDLDYEEISLRATINQLIS
jgi:hypothetical protein